MSSAHCSGTHSARFSTCMRVRLDMQAHTELTLDRATHSHTHTHKHTRTHQCTRTCRHKRAHTQTPFQIQEAHGVLSDPAKRKEYDSIDDFDDSLPLECAPVDFFKVHVCACVCVVRVSACLCLCACVSLPVPGCCQYCCCCCCYSHKHLTFMMSLFMMSLI